MRVGRLRVVAAALVGGLLAAGCVGGSPFGTNPAEGGCGFRPEGLVVDDITGVWAGNGQRFTLKLGGVITWAAIPVPPSPQPSASGRSSIARPARPARPSASTGPSTRPSTGPSTGPTAVEATGRWALRAETLHGDIDITDVQTERGPVSFGHSGLYVSGSRRKPWMYSLGDGDPDSCEIIKYERVSRG